MLLKPRIRILHNLARSGGTLVSKCIGCMDNVALLSEIHPGGWNFFSPATQAREWYQLLSKKELRELEHMPLVERFVTAITLIEKRCSERGLQLVIRDWAHLDYVGVPFVPRPSYSNATAQVLETPFEVSRISLVRHPMDQWLSLATLDHVYPEVEAGRFTAIDFLNGYRRYAEHAVQHGFFRYDDFTRQPDEVLKTVCEALQLSYDASYAERWHEYMQITGDTSGSRGDATIRPLKRREMPPDYLKQMQQVPTYHEILKLLGYPEEPSG